MSAKKVQFQIHVATPSDHLLRFAQESLDSPDENLRCVSKAVLDVTKEAVHVTERLTANDGHLDLAPLFDFWFGDSIAAAKELENSPVENVRYLARCLISQEQGVIKSKQEFLQVMKNSGIRPKH